MKIITRREALGSIFNIAGVAVIAGSGCAVNPVTGKRELMLITERQETGMGAQAHDDICGSYGVYGDDTTGTWFNGRGQEMAKVTHRANLNYTFTVLDSPVINAFAVPGGYVYVTRGILAYFNDEAQFAGVLGHELGHVNARHTAARYSKAKLANIGLQIGTVFSEEFGKYAQFVSLGTTLLFLKFSRVDEREADKLGVQYSSAVGYDAVQMSEFFRTLERMHPKGGSLPAWQSTHPDPGNRIADTKRMALAYQQEHSDRKFVIRKNEYLDLVDGIIYGDDPRQGYVKDDNFYHPTLKFMFPVPSGWNVSNKPGEVRMSPEKQNCLMIFTAASGKSPVNAARMFASENGVEVTSTKNITVNGMIGVQTIGELVSGGRKLPVVSYFVRKDNTVFSLHGLASAGELEKYYAVFDKTATGFKLLTNTSYINVSPQKIEVRSSKGKMTLRDALNKFGVSEDMHDNLALLNGLELKDTVSGGFRIKLIS